MAVEPEKAQRRKIFIIGGNARLAKAIINYYKNDEIIAPERHIYKNWSDIKNQDSIVRFFDFKISNDSLIFITSGILNAKEEDNSLEKVNFLMPLNVIKALDGIDVKIITFGTILEKIRETENAYVKSKINLSDSIGELKTKLPRVIHIRLHTLYGYDYPSKFMFLGQIFDSIKNKTEFNMSSGMQIREYHHFDDVAKSVDAIIKAKIYGITSITAENGLRLRDLASKIFHTFQLDNLINIGTIDVSFKDKFQNDYKKNPILENVNFREPIEGVTSYLKSLLELKS